MNQKTIRTFINRLQLWSDSHDDMIDNCSDTDSGQDRAARLEERQELAFAAIEALEELVQGYEL